MNRDLLGEKTALDQTKLIAEGVPKDLPLTLRNKVIHAVLEKQLKNYTDYNRLQRRKVIKDLLKRSNNVRFPSPTKIKNKTNTKVLNEKQSQNIAGQGSQ